MSRKSNYHSQTKRDQCYFCPARHDLEEHHIIPQRFGGPDEADNVVTVCERCHNKLERLYNKSFFEWFGIDDEEGERTFHRACGMKGCTNQTTRKLLSAGEHEVLRCEEHKDKGMYWGKDPDKFTIKVAEHIDVQPASRETIREIAREEMNKNRHHTL